MKYRDEVRSLDYPNASFDVDVDTTFNLLNAVIHEWMAWHYAGIIDQDVNVRNGSESVSSCSIHLWLIRDITTEGMCFTACVLNEFGCLTGSCQVDVPAHYSTAMLCPE